MSAEQWAAASGPIRHEVESYFRARGREIDSPAVQSTIRTNTDLVPRRAEYLVNLARALTGLDALEGARVVEVGCGFGALASYLAVTAGTNHVLGIDVRADFIESAQRTADGMQLADRLAFAVDDMRELATIGDQSVDLAILNNAFIYLTTAEDMDRALETVRQKLAPGGHVLLYHANKWTLREPFTKDPLVHVLPAPLARAVSRVTGWKHNHGRVRLIGPREIRRRLRRAGFEAPRTGILDGDRLLTGRSLLGRRWYGAAARRPA